jgi:hypothetical protein
VLLRLAVVASIATIVNACSELPLACTSIARPAIRARISDSSTGRSAAFNASLILQRAAVYDSNFFDEAVGLTSASDAGAPIEVTSNASEPGSYTVRGRRTGYALWSADNVHVQAERCGAIATQLDVRLQPMP